MTYNYFMLRRVILLIACLLLVHSSSALALEEASDNEVNPVIITEIYANAPGSSELGHEYIELHNQSLLPVNLDGYLISRAGNSSRQLLDGLSLVPGEYLAIITSFSLLNSGGTVYLHYPSDETEELILEQNYISLDESHSWSLIGKAWQESMPTPSESNPVIQIEPDEETDEEETESEVLEPDVCQISTVFINEIVANPAGSDTRGGEFVELYNGGKETVSLEGCKIKTDKLDEFLLPNAFIEPNGYFVARLSNNLLNGGGTVTFLTATQEYEVVYPTLGDDESWSIIDGEWITTELMTPGTLNQPTPQKQANAVQDDSSSACPEGKFRNPETNRCKTIVETAGSLLPCSSGSTRNPETNRCRKISTSIASTLKACAADQERNPDTNRCRKIQSTETTLKECEEGEERNPDTNRCRKAGKVLSGSTINSDVKEAGIHSGVFVIMTLLAAMYGIYEYRLDFANIYSAFKLKLLKSKKFIA